MLSKVVLWHFWWCLRVCCWTHHWAHWIRILSSFNICYFRAWWSLNWLFLRYCFSLFVCLFCLYPASNLWWWSGSYLQRYQMILFNIFILRLYDRLRCCLILFWFLWLFNFINSNLWLLLVCFFRNLFLLFFNYFYIIYFICLFRFKWNIRIACLCWLLNFTLIWLFWFHFFISF